jgi:hypothetical protein
LGGLFPTISGLFLKKIYQIILMWNTRFVTSKFKKRKKIHNKLNDFRFQEVCFEPRPQKLIPPQKMRI